MRPKVTFPQYLSEAEFAYRRGEKPSAKKAVGGMAKQQRMAWVIIATEHNLRA